MSNAIVESAAKTLLETFPPFLHLLSSKVRETNPLFTPGQVGIMMNLAQHEHTPSELAEKMSVSAATMSNSITVLEERGWVERTRSKEDRRVVIVALTDDGRSVLHEFKQENHKHVKEILSNLTADELEVLVSGFEVLKKLVREQYGIESPFVEKLREEPANQSKN